MKRQKAETERLREVAEAADKEHQDLEAEAERLREVAEAADKERQDLEVIYEINLQKTIHHLKKEMEQVQRAQIAKLREEHQAEVDRMMEVSKCKFDEKFAKNLPRFFSYLLSHFLWNLFAYVENEAVIL